MIYKCIRRNVLFQLILLSKINLVSCVRCLKLQGKEVVFENAATSEYM
jgi:hypothetical protein